jgi:hypothetical protein
MFWTHDPATGQDLPVHISWGSPDGRRWSAPESTGLPGQHCQPIAVGGNRLVAVYARRREAPGIRAIVSRDFGRTWDKATETVLYASALGAEAGEAGPRREGDLWDDMVAWRFGHPRGVLLPDGSVLVVYYAGDDETKSARWARLALDGSR